MSQETVEQMIRFLTEDPNRLRPDFEIVWHGGEPTSVPISFYESAFDIARRVAPEGVRIPHRFTTNATLINQQWCDLFKRWGVRIRVSIDGPQWLHDANRVDRSGHGTFERVMRGIEFLRSNGIPFQALGTLTNQSLDCAEELWQFYRRLGATTLNFSLEEIKGANRESTLQSSDYDRCRNFFKTILELRDRDAPGFFVREVDRLIQGSIYRLGERPVEPETLPLMIINVAWDGGISTFSPELLDARHESYGDFIFGNVGTHSLADIAKSSKLRLMYSHIWEGVRQCEKSCHYFKVCGGGCPAPKLFRNGTFKSTETTQCRLRVKAAWDAILDYKPGHSLNETALVQPLSFDGEREAIRAIP